MRLSYLWIYNSNHKCYRTNTSEFVVNICKRKIYRHVNTLTLIQTIRGQMDHSGSVKVKVEDTPFRKCCTKLLDLTTFYLVFFTYWLYVSSNLTSLIIINQHIILIWIWRISHCSQFDDNLFFVLMDRAQELLLMANVPRGTTGLSKKVNKSAQDV